MKKPILLEKIFLYFSNKKNNKEKSKILPEVILKDKKEKLPKTPPCTAPDSRIEIPLERKGEVQEIQTTKFPKKSNLPNGNCFENITWGVN